MNASTVTSGMPAWTRKRKMNKPIDPFNVKNSPQTPGREMTLVSAYLPSQLAERLALIALAQGQSRSMWIVKAVASMVTNQKNTADEIIMVLARRIRSKWNFIVTSKVGQSWNSTEELSRYLENTRQILKRRGVSSSTVETILKRTGLV